MFIVLGTLILFYSLLFWYAIHENSVDARKFLEETE